MALAGRTFAAGSAYRYGFNGQEKSDEVGDGLSTAMFWEYDSRIGRRWNLDPKPNVGISEYSTFYNSPISLYDKQGDTPSSRTFVFPVPQALWPDIYKIDKKYSDAYPQYASTVTLFGRQVTLLRFTYKKEKPNNNRKESERAWPDIKNFYPDLFQVHECAYACTWEGGKPTIRGLADKKQNQQHGNLLGQMLVASGLENRGDFYVALIPNEPEKEKKQPPLLPLLRAKDIEKQVNNPQSEPKVLEIDRNWEKEHNQKAAIVGGAIVVGSVIVNLIVQYGWILLAL